MSHYKVKELERKVRGLQQEITKLHAENRKREKDNRNKNILSSVESGVSQTRTAKIYELSVARVNQIVRQAKRG